MSGALLAVTGSTTGSVSDIDVTTWQTQLELATAAQFVASNGGTNLSAAYSQPFVILAGVTLDDAYLSEGLFPKSRGQWFWASIPTLAPAKRR